MMCDKNFFLKNAVSFLFSNRIQNGLHHPWGLIFLYFMQILKKKIKICLKFWKSQP